MNTTRLPENSVPPKDELSQEQEKIRTVWHAATVTRSDRERQNRHGSFVLWFTGLSGSGKSTLANQVSACLFARGLQSYVLDGDNVRHGLCSDLGFSDHDRSENIRRIGELAKLLVDAGLITLAAFISPFRADRQRARNLLNPGDFVEVYVRCPLEVCEQRDVKLLYKLARANKIKAFTGISSPYEEPLTPDLIVDTAENSVEECVEQIIDYILDRIEVKR